MRLVLRNEFVYIALLGALLLILILGGAAGLSAPLGILRLALGLFFLLFVPGYTLQAAIFPDKQSLDATERLALSIGLSAAVISVLALVLDRLPWGLRLWPIVIAEAAVILVGCLAALLVRRRIPAESLFRPALTIRPRAWWREQTRISRVLYSLIAASVLLVACSALAIVVLPRPGEQFTEFYALGEEGLAENYPRQAGTQDLVSVTLGITNLERKARVYRVEVWVQDPWDEQLRQKVAESIPVSLGRGENIEWPLAWQMPWKGPDQQIDILLFVDEEEEPYRRLQLFMDVVEGRSGG